MTAIHPGFLQDILAHPADDAPRLILADYLEEHGAEERAEFIRVQVDLEGRSLADLSAFQLRDREEELLWATSTLRHPRLGERPNLFFWAGPAVHLVPNGAAYTDHLTFRRGFVAEVTCTAADWFAHADAMTAYQPIEKVILTRWPNFDSLMQRGWRNVKDFAGKTCSELFAEEWPAVVFTFPPGEDMTDLNSLLYALQAATSW